MTAPGKLTVIIMKVSWWANGVWRAILGDPFYYSDWRPWNTYEYRTGTGECRVKD